MTHIRIAIAGASGTGKTTLAQALMGKYNLPINPVGSRSIALQMGLQNPYEVDALGRREEFQAMIFHEKRAWEASHDSFVTDRTVFDNLAYCLLHMGPSVTNEMLAEHTEAMRRYDLVFMVWQDDFIDLDDVARVKSPVYHWAYERLLTGIFSRSRMFAHSLPGDRVKRAAEAFEAVDKLIEKKRLIEQKHATLAPVPEAFLAAQEMIRAVEELMKNRTGPCVPGWQARHLTERSYEACRLYRLPRRIDRNGSTADFECDLQYNLEGLRTHLGFSASPGTPDPADLLTIAREMLAIALALPKAASWCREQSK